MLAEDSHSRVRSRLDLLRYHDRPAAVETRLTSRRGNTTPIDVDAYRLRLDRLIDILNSGQQSRLDISSYCNQSATEGYNALRTDQSCIPTCAVPVIDVMLSSTISDLILDRKAIMSALTSTNLVQMHGITPIPGPAYGSSPYVATIDLAERCHLYVLLLGRRYGPSSELGKSGTELEYDAAYKDDPTKILIFRKAIKPEPEQQKFIDRVSEYHRGYYIREYRRPAELGNIALESLVRWLEDRAALGTKLDYFDHFIRLAIQKSPFPGVRPTYVVSDDYLELKYRFLGKSYTIHFDKGHLYRDFWGSMATLERRFEEWRMVH